LNGAYDGYFGDYRNEMYTYSMADLAKSEVAKYLHKALPAVEVINKAYITKVRETNAVRCEKDEAS